MLKFASMPAAPIMPLMSDLAFSMPWALVSAPASLAAISLITPEFITAPCAKVNDALMMVPAVFAIFTAPVSALTDMFWVIPLFTAAALSTAPAAKPLSLSCWAAWAILPWAPAKASAAALTACVFISPARFMALFTVAVTPLAASVTCARLAAVSMVMRWIAPSAAVTLAATETPSFVNADAALTTAAASMLAADIVSWPLAMPTKEMFPFTSALESAVLAMIPSNAALNSPPVSRKVPMTFPTAFMAPRSRPMAFMPDITAAASMAASVLSSAAVVPTPLDSWWNS